MHEQASQKIDSFYLEWSLQQFREDMQRLIKPSDIEKYEDICALVEAVYTLHELEIIDLSKKNRPSTKSRRRACNGCVFKKKTGRD